MIGRSSGSSRIFVIAERKIRAAGGFRPAGCYTFLKFKGIDCGTVRRPWREPNDREARLHERGGASNSACSRQRIIYPLDRKSKPRRKMSLKENNCAGPVESQSLRWVRHVSYGHLPAYAVQKVGTGKKMPPKIR